MVGEPRSELAAKAARAGFTAIAASFHAESTLTPSPSDGGDRPPPCMLKEDETVGAVRLLVRGAARAFGDSERRFPARKQTLGKAKIRA